MRLRNARAVIVGVGLSLASTLYAREFNWPDYYHIEYGFPAAWVVRTLNTIAGPTDKLAFQPLQFILDLMFWTLVAFLILPAINRVRGSSHKPVVCDGLMRFQNCFDVRWNVGFVGDAENPSHQILLCNYTNQLSMIKNW